MRIKSVIITMVMMVIASSYAQTRITVGSGKQYASIAAAVQSIPKPMTTDVILVVDVPFEGYTESGTTVDINTLQASGHSISIVASNNIEYTYYTSPNYEFRFSDDGNDITRVETVDGVNGTFLRNVFSGNTSNSTNEYLVKNYLGSTITVIDKDGNRVGPVYDYYPFGKQVMLSVATSGVGKNILSQTFTGKEMDFYTDAYPTDTDGLGLYYFGARYYDADIGRWVSTDPVKQFFDRYNYCGNNPTNRTDPDGRVAPAVVAYATAVMTSPDLQNDLQMFTMDAANGDYIGAAGDAAGVLVPGLPAQATRAGAKGAVHTGEIVLGHFPAYVMKAKEIGAKTFTVPTRIWDKMSVAMQWAANKKFLDRAISRGDRITLATPLSKIKPGSFYERELLYLIDHGYEWNKLENAMVKVSKSK